MSMQRRAAERNGKVNVSRCNCKGWGFLLATCWPCGPWPVLMSRWLTLFIPHGPHSDFSPLPPRSLLLSKDIKRLHVAVQHVCLSSAIASGMTAVKFCLGQSLGFTVAVNTSEDKWPSTLRALPGVSVWGLAGCHCNP